jgi:SAM-dependent methyltransferase
MSKPTAESIRSAVSNRYGAIARTQLEKDNKTPDKPEASCCGSKESSCEAGSDAATSHWADQLYSAKELGKIDESIAKMTLGSGNPIALAELQPGETVLDLGSGAGLDCFLAALRVGPEGKVIGVDMTPEMLELADRNLKKVGTENVEFREGTMEHLPVATASVDVIISNCVINLSPEKSEVLREAHRVLKPGGRFRVSDIVWERPQGEEDRANVETWPGCVSGALTIEEFKETLEGAGFADVEIDYQNGEDSTGWSNANSKAVKPSRS